MVEALYFPRLSLPNESWVNPALLFFDRIQVIAPIGREDGLYDRRTAMLIDEDLVLPVIPGMDGWESATDEPFVRFLMTLPGTRRRRREPAHLHLGKLGYTQLANHLLETRLFVPERDGWLVGEGWAVTEVLTYLALQMAMHSSTRASLVTDEGPIWRQATGFAASQRRLDRKTLAVTTLLPASADVEVHDLLRFRRRNHAALREFRNFVEDLVAIDPAEPNDDLLFLQRLREAEHRRDELVRDLEMSRLSGTAIRTTISAAPIAAALVEGSPWSAGAAALAVGQQIYQEAGRLDRALRARRRPLAYAAIAKFKRPG